MNKKPLVSVVTITYNHELYISKTIDGVLMQNCDFDIEFIIANDNSIDKTDLVIKEHLKKNKIPENIKIGYSNHDENKGMMDNFIWALGKAEGKYIALCEGDDYWTDPLKLQKQVDILEENEEYVATFHQVSQLNFNGNIEEPKDIENYSTDFFGAIQGAFGRNTLSTVVKKEAINFDLLEKSRKSKIGDIYVMVGASLKGKGFVINDNMGMYRHHVGGASKNYNPLFYYQSRVGIFEYIEENLNESDERKAFYRAFATRFAKQELVWIVKSGNFHLLKSILRKYNFYRQLSKTNTLTFEETLFREQFRKNHKTMKLSFLDTIKAVFKFITRKHYINKFDSPYA